MTSSFVFDSAAEAHARFTEQQAGNVYSRFTNPTVRAFEERLASLEDGSHCRQLQLMGASVKKSVMLRILERP